MRPLLKTKMLHTIYECVYCIALCFEVNTLYRSRLTCQCISVITSKILCNAQRYVDTCACMCFPHFVVFLKSLFWFSQLTYKDFKNALQCVKHRQKWDMGTRRYIFIVMSWNVSNNLHVKTQLLTRKAQK